jgi:hypothetical protein
MSQLSQKSDRNARPPAPVEVDHGDRAAAPAAAAERADCCIVGVWPVRLSPAPTPVPAARSPLPAPG